MSSNWKLKRARLLELFQEGVPRYRANAIMKKEFKKAPQKIIKNWWDRFSKGNFSINNKPSKWVRRIFEAEDVKSVLAKEPNLSSIDLAKRLKTTKGTVLNRLHEMKYIHLDGKWVPSLEDILQEPDRPIPIQPKVEKIIMKMELDLSQKVFIVRSCYENRRDYKVVVKEFESYFNVQTTESMVLILQNIVEIFEETGSINEEFVCEVIETTTTTVDFLEPLEPKNEITEESPIKKDIDMEFVDVDGRYKKPKPTKQFREGLSRQKPHRNIDLRKMPLQSQTHECETCHKICSSLISLRTHREIHAGKSYECEICHKSYKTKGYLRRHKRGHGPKRFICDYCGKASTQKTNHDKHMAVHFANKSDAIKENEGTNV